MTTTEALMSFETKTADGISRTRCFDANREELAGALNFPESTWRGNPRRCIAAAALPLVSIPAALDAMPADLLDLPDDAQIVARREIARYDAIEKAGKVRAEVADAIERHAAGLFNAREVAHMIHVAASAASRAYKGDSGIWFQKLTGGFKAGRLIALSRTETIYRHEDAPRSYERISRDSAAQYAISDCVFRLDDVNAWLDGERAACRLQPPAALAAPAAVPVVSAPAVAAPEPVAPYAEDVQPVNGLPTAQWKVPRSNRWTKAAKDQMHAMRASYSDAQIAQAFGLKHPRQVGNLIGSRAENAASKESSKSHRRLY